MAISGYRLPQQIGGGTANGGAGATHAHSNTAELVKREVGPPENTNPASSSTTMLDMWAASKVEAANSNSNSSSTLGGAAPPPTPPPISGGGGVNERSSSTGSISTPGSIKGRQNQIFTLLYQIYVSLQFSEFLREKP